MTRIWLAILACLLGCSAAAEPLSFQGKTITVIVPYATGGGTDMAGRLIGDYLGRLLPGAPTVIARNMPGADGMAGMNYFVEKVKPDGLTIVLGAGTTSDPLQY